MRLHAHLSRSCPALLASAPPACPSVCHLSLRHLLAAACSPGLSRHRSAACQQGTSSATYYHGLHKSHKAHAWGALPLGPFAGSPAGTAPECAYPAACQPIVAQRCVKVLRGAGWDGCARDGQHRLCCRDVEVEPKGGESEGQAHTNKRCLLAGASDHTAELSIESQARPVAGL